MAKDQKLDWIYKGANSLVDREEYLLGRKVDKPLEQLNEDEKVKKIVLPTPKNHVEHECIPPSIRDFNKIVQAEQVDLSAKLQEDPLVAIKKREEEARRQFLQNPVQLKKLQDALKKKEGQKRKHKSKKNQTNNDLDEKIREKLKKLKSNPLGIGTSKKESKKDKEDVLNTILMHKFNALKDKLSEEDLKDILNGKLSDNSDDEEPKKKDILSESDDDQKKHSKSSDKRRTSRGKSKDFDDKKRYSNKKHKNQESSDEDERRWNITQSRTRESSYRHKHNSRDQIYSGRERFEEKYKRNSRSRSRSKDNGKSNRRQSRDQISPRRNNSDVHRKVRSRSKEVNKYKKNIGNFSSSEDDKANGKLRKTKQDKNQESINDEDSDSELDRKIMAQLKLLRGETETKINKSTLFPVKPPHFSTQIKNSSSDDSSESEGAKKYPENLKRFKQSSEKSSSSQVDLHRYSDSEDEKPQLKSFGLVTSDGKQIALKKIDQKNYAHPVKKVAPTKPEKKHVKKMTEKEKEILRKEMMYNAKARDKEREENVKRYRETDKCEEEMVSKKYDANLVHCELLKSAKHSSVEQRIKSNLNNIQRSSRHMDQNFSKR